MNYRLHCTNWAMMFDERGGFAGGRDAPGWRTALRRAGRLARENGSPCRVYDRRGRFLLAEVDTDGVARILKRPVPSRRALGRRFRSVR